MAVLAIRELSLRQRLLLLTMVTSGIGVLLGCLGFLAYDLHVARDLKENELDSAANLIGTNATAALAFDDAMGGSKLLSALSTTSHVRLGVLYRRDGSLFASYVRPDLNGKITPPPRPPDGIVWRKDSVNKTEPVLLDGRQLGAIYVESDLTDLQERLRRFEQLTVLLAMGCLLLVYFLTAVLQRGITRPIRVLAAVARSIADEKAYTLRAPALAGVELRQLSADFNHMLEQIERRDAALREARDTQEQRVAERTRELELEVRERQRTEHELQQRTTFLNTLIAKSPLAILVGGPDGKLELVNPAFEKMFGYTREETVGQRIDELLFPAKISPEDARERIHRLKSESILETTQRMRKDGKMLDVEVHAVPLELEDGQAGVLTLYQDIGQRVEAQRALRESEELFRTLSAAAPVGIFRSDGKAHCLYVNKYWQEITGLSLEEALGEGYRQVVHPADRERMVAQWEDSAGKGSVFSASYRYLARNGNVVWVETIAQPLLDKNGSPQGYVGVVKDVTERQRTEAALRERTSFLDTLITSNPIAITVIAKNGRVESANPAFQNLFGYTSDEIIGKPIGELIAPPDMRAEVESNHLQTVSRTPVHKTTQRMRKDGRIVDVEVQGVPLLIEGKVESALVLYQDISERVAAVKALREAKNAAEAASRSKSEFLANMSHEIRTPMNGILGMTELALDTELNPDQREYLDMVKSSAESLLSIINDILDFSKIEAGRLELESVPFSLLDCIESVLQPLAVRAHQKGLELTWAVQGEIPEVLMGDPTRLRQILINLAGNAIKFTKAGEVSVRAERVPAKEEGIAIRFSVSDTGIGIPKEKHQLIFDAFSQADSSTTREFGGTGLGLSISARLIRLMNGELGLESAPGKGSDFTFMVRFGAGRMVESAPPATLHPEITNKKVLVVDDNEVNRRLLMRLLPEWGLEPVCAAHGFDALEIIEKSQKKAAPFALILLDQNMPGMDGYEVAGHIRQMTRGERIPIVILSSAPSSADQHRDKRLGIERRLTKPLRRAMLHEAVFQALGVAVPSEKEKPHDTERGQGLRLLLAEDNSINQKLAIRLLEKMGHHVTLAVNGQEAIEMLRQKAFDLVLMDIQMPVIGGVEATRRIREEEHGTGAHTPIIAMTAHAMAGDAEKCLQNGMDGYVSKPIRMDSLRAEIGRLVNGTKPDKGRTVKLAERDSSSWTFDPGELLARVDNDRELLRDLLTIFKVEFPRHLAALREAVEARDGKRVAAVAHTMKGMLFNLAATQAATTAASLEQMGRQGKASGFQAAFAAFESDAMKLLPQLDACMAEVCG